MSVCADEDVFWFEVAVDYASGVETVDTLDLYESK